MSFLSTHVLNTATGQPAAGVKVSHIFNNVLQNSALTDSDGRIAQLDGGKALEVGHHKLRFEMGAYFDARQVEYFFPEVVIDFLVKDSKNSHHVPLLISGFGFSTYRGS